MIVEHDRPQEREAQVHDRSAARFERHAALLERYGARRFADTERLHAAEEREAAQAARRRPACG